MHRHHAWTSFEAVSEIYNEAMRTTNNINAKYSASYFAKHPVFVRTQDAELDAVSPVDQEGLIM